jgi:hypothetical protein
MVSTVARILDSSSARSVAFRPLLRTCAIEQFPVSGVSRRDSRIDQVPAQAHEFRRATGIGTTRRLPWPRNLFID